MREICLYHREREELANQQPLKQAITEEVRLYMNETNTMQAIRFHDYGGPEQLVLERVPRPEVQPGTVLVRVKAAGVNPWDWKLRSGAVRQFMPVELPYTPGIELAGIVEALGPGVSAFRPGDAVYGSGNGTNAEYALAPAGSLAPRPASLTFDQAAAVPVGANTAWRALRGDGRPAARPARADPGGGRRRRLVRGTVGALARGARDRHGLGEEP